VMLARPDLCPPKATAGHDGLGAPPDGAE
jgi:hypothetical protein